MDFYCTSHIGKVRKNNEDYCKGEIIKTQDDKTVGIFAIADGMGGHNKGEVASQLAVENILSILEANLMQNNSIKIEYIDDIIKQAYNDVNTIIYEKSISEEGFEGMGTTLTVVVIYEDTIYIANVGDSRAYIYRNEELRKITIDHSVVEELVRANVITEKEALTHPQRNSITRAMGTEPIVLVDIFKEDASEDYLILLATDGLTGVSTTEEIREVIEDYFDIETTGEELINLANDKSGRDNASVILVKS